MRSGWLRGSTVTAVPTRTRRVRVAIELATCSEDEITERDGLKWISPSHTQSMDHASERAHLVHSTAHLLDEDPEVHGSLRSLTASPSPEQYIAPCDLHRQPG